jgi:hypothetical protein
MASVQSTVIQGLGFLVRVMLIMGSMIYWNYSEADMNKSLINPLSIAALIPAVANWWRINWLSG